MTIRALTASLAALAALQACQSAPPRGDADLYHGFTMIDPATERVVEDAFVVVRDGRIAEIGDGAPPAGAFRTRRDLSGLFGLPGFVDGHGHITAGPHRIEIVDGAPAVTIESVDEITRFHARMALAFGVTTVRNPAGDPAANARYDAAVASGEWIGPDALHAGAAIQPPPFTGSAFAYPQTDAAWDAEARRQAELGMTYFKLYQGLTEDELARGIEAAHAHGLEAIAHLDQVSWTRAAELGIDGLEHALPTSPDLLEPEARAAYLADYAPDSRFYYRWFEAADYDGPLMRGMIATLAERRVVVNMTFLVNEIVYNMDRLDRVLPVEDRRYAHPEALAASLTILQAGAAAWSEEDFARARAMMPKVLELGRRLHEAGVPMLAGTDGNGGGPIYARELAHHVDAGIPVWDVLRMATSDAAAIMGLGAATGSFSVGKEADMAFLAANPLDDIANARRVAFVVTNGRAHAVEALTADIAPE